MFEMAVWKTVFGAVGVLALLAIPVVIWMRLRAVRRAKGSAHAWGGVMEDGPGGSAPDGWEDVSSRFIDDFIPDVDEDQEEAANRGSAREAAGNSPDLLDHMEEGVRVIGEESREVLPEDEVLPPEGESLPEGGEEPALRVGDAPAAEPGAAWWEGLPALEGAEHPRTPDELPEAALDEPPGSAVEDEPSREPMEDVRAADGLDSETQITVGDVPADEGEEPGISETIEGADAPLRMRIPAVSEVRDDVASGDDAPGADEEEEEALHLAHEDGVAADAPAEPALEERADVDDEVSETAAESPLKPPLEGQEDEPPPSRPEVLVLAGTEPDEASPDPQALDPDEASSTPEPEEKAAAAVGEEDIISLIQRERAEDDAFTQSGAAQEQIGVEEDADAFEFPLEDDGEQLVSGAAPPAAASHEPPANTPSELIRELVADICPEDLLLAENMEQKLPAWTPGVVNAAGIDLGQRERARQTPAAEEYLRLAILEMMLGRVEDATEHLKESLRRTSRLAPVLNALAVASYMREKVEPAISYSREAFREAGRDVPVQAVISRNLGYFYQQRGDDEKAAESYEKALGYIGPQGELEQLSVLRMRVGRLFRRLGEKEKAREHLSEAAHLFHRLGDRRNEARAHTVLASVLSETGEYEAAQVSLDDALNLCQKIGDKACEALVYSQMGVSFAAQEQFTRALRYYENALRLNRGLENRRGEAANLSGMGNIHYARGDLPEAREAYEAALEINREQGSILAQGVALGSLGRVHFEGREWEASRECLTEARRIFQDLGEAEALDSIMKMLRTLDKRNSA
ncbi:MAG: tetratricopeptide repeat protein [Nitrospinae bacterium]|nr:tetratricopeptide repeat protein [Nitrospinota bacterium]